MSVGPGVKPVTPALPLVPNKLKLFAVTSATAVSYFRRDGRLVAGDQAIVEGEGSAAAIEAMALDTATGYGDIA